MLKKSDIDAGRIEGYVTQEDIFEDMMLFKIPNLYDESMSMHELYEATRGFWEIDLKKSEDVSYAVPIYKGVALAVFEMIDWLPAGSTEYSTRTFSQEEIAGRYEFIGTRVPSKVYEAVIDKSFDNIVENIDGQADVYYVYKQQMG